MPKKVPESIRLGRLVPVAPGQVREPLRSSLPVEMGVLTLKPRGERGSQIIETDGVIAIPTHRVREAGSAGL
jgi:hypothetical protein